MVREREYTPQGNLRLYLPEYGEYMRRWDGKPTSDLVAQVCELRGGRTTTGNLLGVYATVVSLGQAPRQNRKHVMSDPLEGTSSSYLQEVSNKNHDKD